VRLPAKIS
jgi:hypothetical protein